MCCLWLVSGCMRPPMAALGKCHIPPCNSDSFPCTEKCVSWTGTDKPHARAASPLPAPPTLQIRAARLGAGQNFQAVQLPDSRYFLLLSHHHPTTTEAVIHVIMEQRRPTAPEYTLEVFADPTCVKDIVKGTHLSSTQTTLYSRERKLCIDLSQQSSTPSSSTATSYRSCP
jgi:hypothetical protein